MLCLFLGLRATGKFGPAWSSAPPFPEKVMRWSFPCEAVSAAAPPLELDGKRLTLAEPGSARWTSQRSSPELLILS